MPFCGSTAHTSATHLMTRRSSASRQFFTSLPDGIGAVLLAGEGENFSAGFDLSELEERDVTQGIAHSGLWHRAFEKIQFGKVPVVAVLHGAVVGGGLELAAAAHVRVAERSAFYALPEGSRGIYVGGGGSVRLPPLIGVARMADMMLTGRTYSAEEGQAIGLTTYLVDAGKGFAKGLELAQRIAGNAPLTNFAVMQALPRIAAMDPASGYAIEALMSAIAQADPRCKSAPEGLSREARAESHAQVTWRQPGTNGERSPTHQKESDGTAASRPARQASIRSSSSVPEASSISGPRKSSAPYHDKLSEPLEHWAKIAPDRLFLAQRDAKGEWRKLTYSQVARPA